MSTPPPSADHAVRAITEDGAFRVITLRTTDTARGALAAQGDHLAGETARHYVELLTGAVLVRETMAPTYRVQLILQSQGGRLVADSHPGGLTRGMVTLGDDSPGIHLDEHAILQVMRVLPRGQVHQGVINARHDEGLSGVFMSYMQVSEQVTSMIAVGSAWEDGRLVASGGYIVQLLPELTEAPLAIMSERLDDFRRIDDLLARTDADPHALMSELLFGFPFVVLDISEVRFGCVCDPARVLGAVATLGREELRQVVADGETLEVGCDWCGKQYRVPPSQLESLLDAN